MDMLCERAECGGKKCDKRRAQKCTRAGAIERGREAESDRNLERNRKENRRKNERRVAGKLTDEIRDLLKDPSAYSQR